MPAKTRKTHTKSRRGCLECKRRKLKCDEEKPTCSGCAKRSKACHFPNPDSSPSPSVGQLLRPVPTSTEIPCPISSAISPVGVPATATLPHNSSTTKSLGCFDTDDMALWHQFVKITGSTMAGPWEEEIPLLALDCDYLLHGILSTAALHLSYLNPGQRDKYEYLSAQHQDLALGPYRQAMSTITSENCSQAFAFSVLMSIAQFAPSSSVDEIQPSPDTALYKGPANWIECLRLGSYIYKQSSQHMHSGPFGNTITEGIRVTALAAGIEQFPQNEDDESLEYISRHLLNLRYIKDSTTVAEMEAYMESISWLRKLLAASSASDHLTRRYFTTIWLAQLPDKFMRMLHEERPPALVIIAHYCLLLKRCDSCWYMERRANYLFSTIQKSLTEEWTTYIEHPLRVFGNTSLVE